MNNGRILSKKMLPLEAHIQFYVTTWFRSHIMFEGDGFHTREVATNKFNTRMTDKGWSLTLGS